ncbi:Anaerobic ribonucleoside triphosphate reductase, partial [human gut metagenome]
WRRLELPDDVLHECDSGVRSGHVAVAYGWPSPPNEAASHTRRVAPRRPDASMEKTVSDTPQIPTAAHLAEAHPELIARGSADSAVAHGSR